jgi:hypothetical protein
MLETKNTFIKLQFLQQLQQAHRPLNCKIPHFLAYEIRLTRQFLPCNFGQKVSI